MRYKQLVKDIQINQFRIFKGSSSKVSPETVMAYNKKRIDRVLRKLQHEFLPGTVHTKSAKGRVGMNAQPYSCNVGVIDVDENDGSSSA